MRLKKYRMILSDNQIIELEQDWSKNLPEISDECNSPQIIDQIMRDHLQIQKFPEEHMYMICTNTRMKKPILFEMNIGTANQSLVNVKGVIQRAMLANAVNVFIVHNHPSGDTIFSASDIEITKRLNEALELVDIALQDHIIIGDSYRSAREEGLL